MDPDFAVSSMGEAVTVYYLSSEALNEWDEYDEDTSTWASYEVNAIVSSPSESEVILFQGQEARLALRMTFPTGTDIEADRAGRPDQVVRGGRHYAVASVHPDRHPWIGAEKLTVNLVQYPGRDVPVVP